MTNTGGSDPFATFSDFFRMWTPPAIAAPRQLSQSILPGWSLISVNETNSAAPDTEQAIVAKASYGRQLGRLIDAVEELIRQSPASASQNAAFEALHELAVDVRKVKLDAAHARIERLRSDLTLLATSDPAEFDRQKKALLALLNEPVAAE